MHPHERTVPNDWQVWQIVDSAFPTGGFAHSGGLEAAWQQGWVRSPAELGEFVRASVRAAVAGGVPFVAGAHGNLSEFERVDREADALLSNHVANRASRVQGAALLATAGQAFEVGELVELRARVRRGGWPGHLAPCFGAVCGCVGVDRAGAVSLYLFQVMRGLMSAAVRLGITGPTEAQRMQRRLAGELEGLSRAAPVGIGGAAQTSPILDLLQGRHERLYSKLFVS